MQLVNYHSDNGYINGQCTGLLIRGRKYHKLIVMNSTGIRIRRLPLAEEKYMTILDSSEKKAAKQFRAAGRRFGITLAAKRALRGL